MNQRGFTLVEVLVSLGIFAFVSAAGVVALNLSLSSAAQLDDTTDRLSELERFRSILRDDLGMIVNRPVREAYQDRLRPAFVGGEIMDDLYEDEPGTEYLFALVRSDWENPDAQSPRPEVQAVVYLLQDGTLIRRTRPYLDAVRDTPVVDQPVLSNVDALDLQFFTDDEWRADLQPGLWPGAVELTIDHRAHGVITHKFIVRGPQ
ncbi:MAG: type II secretion system minor pseudopilin GspJ [Pseudomonadota bacterium]